MPLTAGNRRTVADVVLYAGVIASAVYLLRERRARSLDDARRIAVLLALLVALGLRDKVPFLAARPEVYGFMLVVCLFPAENFIVAWQLIFFCIWWGAASSKLNRHFPYVVSVMISNTPWNPSRKAKSRLWRRPPGGRAPWTGGGVLGPPRHGDRVRPAAGADPLQAAARSARSPWRGW